MSMVFIFKQKTAYEVLRSLVGSEMCIRDSSPFGLALQGVRDNPRRMAALGFNVTAHRVAAYALASVFASTGGILLVWQNAQIAPGTIGISSAIDVLVVAVVGGIRPAPYTTLTLPTTYLV